MSFKVVVFDMDGTLLNSQRQIHPATVEALDKLKKQGVRIMLATGRHHISIYPYNVQLQLDTPAICCNGTYVYDFAKKQVLQQNTLTKVQAYQVLSLIRDYGIHSLIYADNEMNYEVLDKFLKEFEVWAQTIPQAVRPQLTAVKQFESVIENADNIFKFTTNYADLDALKEFHARVNNELGLSAEWSWVDRVDIAQKGNTKGAGLKRWLESQGLTLQDAIAFGDNENDLSMLTTVGLGVAMGNADDHIKSQASCVIGDNNSDAIAKKLTEVFAL